MSLGSKFNKELANRKKIDRALDSAQSRPKKKSSTSAPKSAPTKKRNKKSAIYKTGENSYGQFGTKKYK